MGVKLTRAQVAQMLQVTPKTLAVWEKQGRVPEPERDWRGWRLYDEEAVATIRRVLNYTPTSVPLVEQPLAPTQISARNRLAGVVRSVDGDGILCEVILDLGNGQEVVSLITRSSVERLGIRPGVAAFAIIKSTEVMLGR